MIYVRLLDGIASEVTVRRHIQRRHVFLDVSSSKTLSEQHLSVGGQSLPRAHVIDFGLLDGVVLEVTVRRHIQRRHLFLDVSPSKNPMKYTTVSAIGHS